MRSIVKLDRRRVLLLMVSTTVSPRALAQVFAAPNDQGIGGTGAAPPVGESDRGIGGTGVIGTIRKFGSIFVNDMRIAYPDDVEVRIDGRPAQVSDLKIGQVVRVAANGQTGALSTRAIDVTSEVVGPVDRLSAGRMVVLGQTVATGGVKLGGVRPGDVVAVSGLRRNDGTIVASLVEHRDGVSYRVAGPVDVAANGSLRIGGLNLSGVNPAFIGQRAVLEGDRAGDRFTVTRGTSEAALLPRGISTLSVESYVERRGSGVTLGSGYRVDGLDGLKLPAGQSVRSIVTTSVGTDGRLTADRLRTGNDVYVAPRRAGSHDLPGGGGRNGESGGSRPDGRSPMNFGTSSGGRPFGGGGPGFGGPGFGGAGGPGGGGRR